MISSEVQRTLVKSPPELWAELSDPAALARHLGELGEIHIVRTEPECTVEWAAENTTGTVSIKPSGWGTNVKLTVTREIVAPEPARGDAPEPVRDQPDAAVEPEAETPEVEPEAELEPAAVVEREAETTAEPESEAVAAGEAPAEPKAEAAVDPGLEASAVDPILVAPKPQPRRGFFARLFGRRRVPPAAEPSPSEAREPVGSPTPAPSPERPDAFAAVREALEPERFVASHPFAALPPAPAPAQTHEPVVETPDEPSVSDISSELMATEEVAAEEVTAVLTAVLDRLGAAHHRPFSRA